MQEKNKPLQEEARRKALEKKKMDQIKSNMEKYGFDESTIRGFQKGEGGTSSGQLGGKGRVVRKARNGEQKKSGRKE
jgi:hypothetical protein